MLPDRAKFYDSLKNYNALQHKQTNSMYGLEYDEHSYYKREGEPGNYRYYWTKQEYEAHLAELEKQRNKNMQAAQNAEADRWKRNDQNKIKEQQVKNNSQANAEADRWKRQEEQRKQQEQDKKWQQQQEDAKKRVAESARQKVIDKNQGNDGESERWKRYEAQKLREKQIKDAQDRVNQREQEKIAKKNEGNDAEAERWKRYEAQKLREKQIKDAQDRVNQREIAKKNQGNDPEAERWKRQQEQEDAKRKAERAEAARKDQEAKEASIKKATDNSIKYNKEVDEIKDATKRLQETQSQTDEQYNKSKKERQDKLTSRKDDLLDMSNYFRKNTSDDDFNKAFEEAKKNSGSENLYFNDGDIKYYDKDAQDKINSLKQEAFKLKQENADLGYRNVSENLDPRTKASNENKYQSNYNEIKRLEREIEITENDMKEKAYEEYEKVLDQMYAFSNTGMGNLQTARERKALDEEKYLKEQEGSWIDQVKKKAKKFFS